MANFVIIRFKCQSDDGTETELVSEMLGKGYDIDVTPSDHAQ